MSSPALRIDGCRILDQSSREVLLRGINVSGTSKLPYTPDIPSRENSHFFDGDTVSFVGRPFPLSEAAEHLGRLRAWGYDAIRYVFTWEALEHRGPGLIDEDFIRFTVDVLRECGKWGFRVIMDPHQDVWSRFSGGSGAPMWTLYAAGLDPKTFVENEAAIVQNTWEGGDKRLMQKMIWTTNYFRTACQVMFTLFFAGKVFAPKAIIDGQNISDYLQKHYINACACLAKAVTDAGLNGDVVVAWESLNEPNRGLCGWVDLTVIPKEQRLRRGTTPTPWQSILLSAGRNETVEVWEIKWNGPQKTGYLSVNESNTPAWIQTDEYDKHYGFKRGKEWQLGECIWAQHGVWNSKDDTLLKPNYFSIHPQTGETVDYEFFVNEWCMSFYRKYRDAIRTIHPDSIMILQGPTLELPPILRNTSDEDKNMASAVHWYDGMTLLFKTWNSWYTMDVVGMMRGKYSQEWLAIKFGGISVIKNCFKDQFIALKDEVHERVGNVPVIFTETGSPFDLSDKAAYMNGDYADQTSALDSVHYALENSGVGYTLWNYTQDNSHEWGDNWNNEDFSIYCKEDPTLPIPVSLTPGKNVDTSKTGHSEMMSMSSSTQSSTSDERSHSEPTELPKSNFRAAEAHIRPWPLAVRGSIISFGFNLENITFTLDINAIETSILDEGGGHPTEIYLPEYHFPLDESTIQASAGTYNMSVEHGMRKLKWWHPEGKQSLKAVGLRKHPAPKGVLDKALESITACLS